MPLQAFNTDANGTMFHNIFSPQILANKQCYLNSQIQTLITTISSNVSVVNNRYNVSASTLYFLPNYAQELLSPPASSTNRRLTQANITGAKTILGGLGSTVTLNNFNIDFTPVDSTSSCFGVFTDKAYAMFRFANSGTALTMPGAGYGVLVGGVVNNPLFLSDLPNTRYNNHFFLSLSATNTFSGSRLANMSSSNIVSFRTSASSSNYTFQCAMNSGDGTTVSGLWATHLALVDSTAAPDDFCIGTVPPIVLLGRGDYTLGGLYKFNNVGEGLTNANAYDRWYVAGPTYGSGGDRLLMQVYYEP